MSIQLIKREQQVDGNFNNGEILEKKPIPMKDFFRDDPLY